MKTRFAHLVALGACSALLASASNAQVALERSRFFFPKEQPNNNGYVGPFCCTGQTAVVRSVDGRAVGYVYFHDFPGGGVTYGKASYATHMTLLISAAMDPSDPQSPHEKGEIAFRAEEMQFKFSRSATVGGLSFTATIGKAPRQFIGGRWRYALGSVSVLVQVSALPPADPGGVPDLPPDGGGEELPPVNDTPEVPPDVEQTTEEPVPQEDYKGALARGLAGFIRDRLHRKKADPAACSHRPDPGPCKAAKQRYYFDPSSGRCEAFTWGGCQGVVPFDSLKACMAACEGR